MRKQLAALSIALLASLACASAPPEVRHIARANAGRPLAWRWLTGDLPHDLFCARVEARGWYDRPVPQGLDPAQSDAYRTMAAKYPARPLGYVPEMSPGARLLAGVDVGSMFAPDGPGAIEDNPSYRPGAHGTVNCYCWSEKRQEVLAVCPEDPDRDECADAAEVESHCDPNGHELRMYDIHILPPYSPSQAAACDRARATLKLCAHELKED